LLKGNIKPELFSFIALSFFCLTAMADDELIVPIDKAFWPRGVMRGLTPLLRALGDKHGNLVVAAVPNKHIMVKGPMNRIEEARPGLRALVEEHFPDAPIPQELGGDGTDGNEAEQEEGEEKTSAPEPPAPKPPSPTRASIQQVKSLGLASKNVFGKSLSMKEDTKTPRKSTAVLVEKGAVKRHSLVRKDTMQRLRARAATLIAEEPSNDKTDSKPVTIRKKPTSTGTCSSALLWECMRQNSSFMRKPCQGLPRPWTTEPGNIMALHSARFSGLANDEVLDLRPDVRGKKEAIQLVQSHAKCIKKSRPGKAFITTGLSKCPKRGLKQLDKEINQKYYRRDMMDLAQVKYIKIKQTFKKKKQPIKSRRDPK